MNTTNENKCNVCGGNEPCSHNFDKIGWPRPAPAPEATLQPTAYAKKTHTLHGTPLPPTHLGGFQNVSYGKIFAGDLLVSNDGVTRVCEWANHDGFLIKHLEFLGSWRVYRKMAVAKQGDAQASPAADRKAVPIATGVIDYFPSAIAAVARLSQIGNEQHNPGKPLHWDRSKSGDESDALMRHFVQRGTRDTDGVRHSAKVAWRALAMLQKEIENDPTKGDAL